MGLLFSIFVKYNATLTKMDSTHMLRMTILFFIAFINYSSVVNAHQCTIVNNTIKKSLDINLPFKSILQKDLEIYTPNPISSIIGDGIVYVFDDNKHIGIFKYFNNYFDGEKPEDTVKNKLLINCKETAIQIVRKDFKFLIMDNDTTTVGNLNKIQVYILTKDDSYFYNLTFAGFSKNEVIQMLIRN